MKRANGEGSWGTTKINGMDYTTFRIFINGKRKSFYGKNRKEVQEKYKKYLAESPLVTPIQEQTFYEYTHNWLFSYKKNKIKPRTFDYYDYITEAFIKDTELGNTTIKDINSLSTKEANKFFTDHLKKYANKSKSTNDGIYTVLNQLCKYGYTYEDFSRNFMIGVEKLSEKEVATKKKEVIALEYSEVMKLWDEMLRKNEPGNVINGKIGSYVYGIGAYALLFCCFTGLRWGEVSCLRWEDIQQDGENYFFKVDKQFITIKDRGIKGDNGYKTIEASPKSKKSERYIPLCTQAREILELVKERFPNQNIPKHLIFSTTDKPYSASTANRLLKVMCIRAEIPVVSPHALRHSFASILLNEDEKNLYAVSDLLGHSSSDVTYKKYIDIFEKSKVNTINVFDNIKK